MRIIKDRTYVNRERFILFEKEQTPLINNKNVLPVAITSDGMMLWGCIDNKIYSSIDGLIWNEWYTFPNRNQGGSLKPDYIWAIQPLDNKNLIVSTCFYIRADATDSTTRYNDANWINTNYGALWLGTPDHYENPSAYGFTKVHDLDNGGTKHWHLDANQDFIIAGTYGWKATDGAANRDLWLSDDGGLTWHSVWHQHGDGSASAIQVHMHGCRIDPHGGVWIFVGDGNANVSGVWHSPGKPRAVSTSATDYGDFTRVYYATTGTYNPINCVFDDVDGKSYIYLTEDGAPDWRDITRIRYDNGSYQAEVVFNAESQGYVRVPAISAIGKFTDRIWVALKNEASGFQEPFDHASRLFYTLDRGNTWKMYNHDFWSWGQGQINRHVHKPTGALFCGDRGQIVTKPAVKLSMKNKRDSVVRQIP